tara:strand:- start:15514 stop:15951 length:438 start_codon:yes stop_codon:yes gene_type:complete
MKKYFLHKILINLTLYFQSFITVKMRKIVFIFAITIYFISISCASDSSDDLIPAETKDPGETPSIETYDGSIKAIVNKSCATTGCHNASTKQSGVDLSTYSLAKAGFSDRSWLRTEAGTMPPSGVLPTTTIAKIKNWVDNDFKEN